MTDPAPTDALLEVRGIGKRYHANGRDLAALENIDLSVPSGQFVALQGPSGAGKSTLLFIIAALLQPDTGSVQIDGTDPYQLRPAARSKFRAQNIGMVFQDFRLLPYLDVRRNILAPALATSDADTTTRADHLIDQLGLAPRRHHRPKQLSAGEQQRTALARALLAKPKLLLADEPTGNLDADNAAQVLEQLHHFAQQGGTVLTATHDPTVAESAHRLITIAEGQLTNPPTT